MPSSQRCLHLLSVQQTETHTHTTAHTASNPQQIVVHHPANVDHEEVLAGDRVGRRLPELWNVDDQAWRCDDVSMTRSP